MISLFSFSPRENIIPFAGLSSRIAADADVSTFNMAVASTIGLFALPVRSHGSGYAQKDDWTKHRQTITHLYSTEDKRLAGVYGNNGTTAWLLRNVSDPSLISHFPADLIVKHQDI